MYFYYFFLAYNNYISQQDTNYKRSHMVFPERSLPQGILITYTF